MKNRRISFKESGTRCKSNGTRKREGGEIIVLN
jgi:hypothetical protein